MATTPNALPATDAQRARAARIGRILLRQEPTAAQVETWAAKIAAATDADHLGKEDAGLIVELVQSKEFAATSRGAAYDVGRACDAVMDRYDESLPVDTAHFLALMQYDTTIDLAKLVDKFCRMRASGYRYDPCASPVDPARGMRLARDADGSPLMFTVGTNGHLHLFTRRGTPGGAWTQIDLSDLLPAPAHGKVLGFDLRQDASGAIALVLALGPRAGQAASVLYAGLGLSNALDPAGWQAAMGKLRVVPGAPDKTVVSNVTLGPDDGAGAPQLLIGAAVQGVTDDFVLDLGDDAAQWRRLRLPEDGRTVRQLAPGAYVMPGLWVLYDIGPVTDLTFTSFPDAFGKTINLSYTQLPAHAACFAVQPGTANPEKPDVFVGGDGLVAYRSGIEHPESILSPAAAPGITYLKVQRLGDAEHVWFVDHTGTLGYVRKAGSAWQPPVALAAGVGGMEFIGPPGSDTVGLAVITPTRTLELRSRSGAAASWTTTVVPVPAVWEEVPLTASEMAGAISEGAPVLYFDKSELYQLSTVDYYLRKVGLWSDVTQSWQYGPGALWNDSARDLPASCISAPLARSATANTDDYYLKVPDSEYTRTSDDGHPYGDLIAGHPQDAPLYVHAKFNPAANATDIVLWLFFPYNGAGTILLEALGESARKSAWPIGIHEGDWEHVMLRVDNDTKKMVSVYLSQHDSGAFVDRAALERDPASGHSVLYASRNGHAVYQQAGDNLSHKTHAQAYHVALVNRCSQGPRFNAYEPGRTQLVSASFLGAQAPVEPQWLQLPWRWGRVHKFSGAEVAQVVETVLGGALGTALKKLGVTTLIGDLLVSKDVLGDEGSTGGPGAPKFKDNWFEGE